MKDSYQYSLENLDEAPSKTSKKFLDAIDDLRNGEKDSEERLYDFVKNGLISVECYNELIEKYRALRIKNEEEREKKRKEMRRKLKRILAVVVCASILCTVIALVITYHENEISNSYLRGYSNGYTDGESDGFSDGVKYYSDIKDEYNYLHQYAVIVTTTGKKYHHYGCYHIKNSRVYIYNIELAESKGYTPCLDCH